MGFARKTLYWILALPLAALTIFVLWLVWPHECEGPVTCSTDAQCGGSVVVRQYCRDGSVYAEGQRNTCVNADSCTSRCETTYQPWLIEECKNGCENGACVP